MSKKKGQNAAGWFASQSFNARALEPAPPADVFTAYKALQAHSIQNDGKLWLPATIEGLTAMEITGQAAYRAGEWCTARVGGFAVYADLEHCTRFTEQVGDSPLSIWRVECSERLTAPPRLATYECLTGTRDVAHVWRGEQGQGRGYFAPDPSAVWVRRMRLVERVADVDEDGEVTTSLQPGATSSA
ncbi:MAG TPA: hypothetical protein VFB99_07885 [Vicinamibacterales bacterium]|nr:hypothetical protein [Vicinamibacterales bacterium]